MVQPHNRHSSMSIYLTALTIPDTIILTVGKSRNKVQMG